MTTKNIDTKNYKEIEVEFTVARTECTSKDGLFISPKKRSKKTIETQNRILNYIYQKTGLKLNVDDWVNQIENIKEKRYFNVYLGKKLYFSNVFQKLKRLAACSDTVYHVEKNGTGVVSIYYK